jgi:hypothetical protein
MNRLIALLGLVLIPAVHGADVTIHPDRPVGPPIVGFGAQMNPYLYCTPNNVGGDSAADFERKVIDLSPQHVRIFFLQQWTNGGEERVSRNDPRTFESFVRTCELAQRAGATINVTLWYGPWTDIDAQMRAFARTLRELIEQRKLTAIRYVTVQNEPNLHADKITPDKYARLYRALDAALRAEHVRDRLKIVSGDLVQDDQENWFARIGQSIGGISDGYSIHAYWDFWDTPKISRRLRLPREIVDALPREQQRPLYVTEFGVRGRRPEPKVEPGTLDDGTPVAGSPVQALQLGQFMVEGLSRGYVAFVIWTLEDAWYDRLMPYGVIGGAKDGWPLKPSYHLLRLFTHTSKPAWRAVKVDRSDDASLVAAMAGPGGEVTVYMLNPTDEARSISVRGLATNRLRQFAWNAKGDGREGEVPVAAGAADAMNVTLPPHALIAVTSVNR